MKYLMLAALLLTSCAKYEYEEVFHCGEVAVKHYEPAREEVDMQIDMDGNVTYVPETIPPKWNVTFRMRSRNDFMINNKHYYMRLKLGETVQVRSHAAYRIDEEENTRTLTGYHFKSAHPVKSCTQSEE